MPGGGTRAAETLQTPAFPPALRGCASTACPAGRPVARGSDSGRVVLIARSLSMTHGTISELTQVNAMLLDQRLAKLARRHVGRLGGFIDVPVHIEHLVARTEVGGWV